MIDGGEGAAPEGAAPDVVGPEESQWGFAEGDEIALTAGDGGSDARRIVIDEPHLAEIVAPGSRIVLGDGTAALEAQVMRDGMLVGFVPRRSSSTHSIPPVKCGMK